MRDGRKVGDRLEEEEEEEEEARESIYMREASEAFSAFSPAVTPAPTSPVPLSFVSAL